MLLTEYDEAETMELFWLEGYREGYIEGFKKEYEKCFGNCCNEEKTERIKHIAEIVAAKLNIPVAEAMGTLEALDSADTATT